MSTPDPFGEALAAQAQQSSNPDPFGAALAAQASGQNSDTPRNISKAEEYIGGPAQLAASSILNIPYGAAHAGADIYNRIVHGDDSGKDPDWVDAIHVPTTPASKKLLADIQKSGNPDDINTQIQNIRNQKLGPPNATVADIANQTGQVAGDVGNLAAGYGLVKGVPGLLSSSSAPLDAQAVVNQATARQSGGAAAAAPNIAGISPDLRDAISKAGSNLDTGTLSRHLEADSLPVPVKLTAGQATQDPVALSTEQNARAKFPQLAQRYTEQNQALIDNLDEIRRTAAPDAVGNDPIQNGQALLDKYKVYDTPKVQAVSAAYDDANSANLAAGKGALKLDPQPGIDHAKSVLEDREDLLPSEGKTILNKMQAASDAGNGIPLKQAETWKTIVARATRKYDQAGDTNAVSALSDFRDSLEQMQPSNAAAGVQAKFNNARSMAKSRFDEIDADPAYKAAVNDDTPIGEQSPLADSFVKKYVIGGNKANLDLMKQKFSGDPEATGTIQASALNYLKSKSGVDPYTNTGNFSQAGYNKARAELEPRMDSLLDPATADQVRTLGNVARYTQAQPRGSFVNNSNTFTAAAGEHAKGMAEGAVNYLAHGVPVGTWARKAIQGKADAATVNRALEPGAGLSGP
jgi:hypothetical protein